MQYASSSLPVRAIIYEKDPNAFVIVSETSEVFGEGFKQVSDS
ncbi:MAG: DUF2179 domain-containing protein [Coprococcus sp.]